MKTAACIVLALCVAGGLASPISKEQQKYPKECSAGPTYWCQNITTAHNCQAAKHCIQTVWEHQKLEADNDDICTICKDMVQQARDQLESNETQEELKEVFEGSCKLIPVKIVSEECMKVFDDFIPELVDALASQMNPQMVCSTAGLCNSARVDKLLAEHVINEVYAKFGQDCGDCHSLVADVRPKLDAASDEDIINRLMNVCGHMGSLSLGCREIVLKYSQDITEHIRMHFNAREVCDLSGVCKAKHHEHARPLLATAYRSDEPCELCEHLVQHMLDVFTANTTEEEFEKVLIGICKMSKSSFRQQCLSLVSEYYPMVYHFITTEMKPHSVCVLAGVCHEGEQRRPLLGAHEGDLYRKRHNKHHLIGGDETKLQDLARVPLTKKESNIQVINSDLLPTPAVPAVLPIELMLPQSMIGGNKIECETCQYFLHYVQQEITLPSTEAEIKELIDEACDHLPKSIGPQCRSFVATYSDALIALLAQEVDPSQVCPSIGLCPAAAVVEAVSKVEGNAACPMCLFAMQQLDKMLKDNRTEDSVKKALESVCSLLPKKMVTECDSFMDKYTEELIDMLIAEYTPEEVCTNLKMCGPEEYEQGMLTGKDEKQSHIETNEIPLPKDDELVKPISNVKDDNKCVICEFVMTQLDDMLKNNATEEDIKKAVHSVCNYLPKSVSQKCNDFVNEYADLVIQLLVQSLEPKQVCQELGLCPQVAKTAEEKCTLCLVLVEAMDKLLEDGNIEKDVATIIDKVCNIVPSSMRQGCRSTVDEYGPSIMLLVAQLADKNDVCSQVKLCPSTGNRGHLLGANKCTYGPSYSCQSEFHAMACKATKYCQQKVWKASKP
ncbi:Hypothetical predicted protein [Cloeon dipterum]|uniref:Saposin B-type domain-containing protein n=1 Tax=Cloeon dipterum TaxID=197152 RepID=A0A8S1C0L8_9INSE|nr:Hypothetical predicted protein [Cloeon dipterum]